MSDPFIAAASLEGVPSAFRAARDGIDAVLRDRGLRRSTPDDTARSLLIGAWATATLEGSECDLDELGAGGGDATARAAVRLSTELLGLLPTWQRSPVQALARIHALAAAGSVPDVDLGRPVNPEGTARLTQLATMLAGRTEAPALVVAALVHAEIAAAGAFVSHNAVVARAAERLVLVGRGVDPASVTVPEAGHVAAAPDYFEALAAYGTQETGVHRWLLYAAEAYTRGAEASPLASR
ncbi:oxidoreductase [Aeromicrobium sp. 179-A 4D2 NHS]|uniref:oxidoreductase n=1 Tax=Aeromicrobium sp. 179-A 4D2 NHS TaxID=3142375 RepID=UPI0039A17B1C